MAGSSLNANAEIVMGQSPPGVTCNTAGVGLPLLNGPTEYGPHHPSPVQFTTDARKRARPGDVLFCVRGSTTGRMNWADREYAIGRGVAAIRHKMKPELQPFVRAVIEYGLPGLLAQATGSTFPNVSADQLASVWWPPLEVGEQRAIAHILGTLDDKIELNRRTNETLEAMARALFKSWFVDFDPVRAKLALSRVEGAAGRDPGLPKPIADLFPAEFQNSELGRVPKGWRVDRLGNILELAYGKGLKEDERHAGPIPVFGSNGQVGWHDTKLVDGPGVIVGRKGNPGIVTWAPTDFFPIDTTFYVIPKEQGLSLYFLFHALQSHDLASLGADSAVPGLNRNMAYMSQQVVPPLAVIHLFDKFCEAMYAGMHEKGLESRTLVAVRDALLPKLLGGETRIKDVEKFVESGT